ncbi:MAG: glycosyltransferase family 1 protein [Chloroflexota bacterium]|nr:MAG: glycosyltransferase family 1 protein [Chloroflexota bacterium]
MKIAVSAEFSGTKTGGVETYEVNTLRALAAIDQTNEYHLYHTWKMLPADRIQQANFKYHNLGPYASWLRVSTLLPLSVSLQRPDLVHVQNAVAPWCPNPVVATIHDLSFETNPETYPAGIRSRLKKLVPATARKAAVVITVYHVVREQLVDLYGIPREKIEVIPNGCAPYFRPIDDPAILAAARAQYNLPDKYLLYAGSIIPRKNVTGVVEAFARLKRNHAVEEKLVLVGENRWGRGEEVFRAIERLGLSSEVVVVGWVHPTELPSIYSQATAFVFPSHYESFGLPVVEAMACGVPPIASNVHALPEIVGQAGLLVDPLNVDDIAQAMVRMVKEPGLRDRLKAEGLSRAKLFSWERDAHATLAVYERVCTSRTRRRAAETTRQSGQGAYRERHRAD